MWCKKKKNWKMIVLLQVKEFSIQLKWKWRKSNKMEKMIICYLCAILVSIYLYLYFSLLASRWLLYSNSHKNALFNIFNEIRIIFLSHFFAFFIMYTYFECSPIFSFLIFFRFFQSHYYIISFAMNNIYFRWFLLRILVTFLLFIVFIDDFSMYYIISYNNNNSIIHDYLQIYISNHCVIWCYITIRINW